MGSYDQLRHVLTHELVHAFQYDILLGRKNSLTFFGPPLWLVEGMAEYLSIGWEETGEMAIRDAVYTDTLPSIEDLNNQRVLSGYSIYKLGQSVMYFIDEVYGEYKISELLRAAKNYSIYSMIKATFGITMQEFNQKWQLWFKRKYADVVHKKLVEEEAFMVTEHLKDGSFLNLHPTISPNGRKIAYLSIRNLLPAIILKDTGNYTKKESYHVEKYKEQSFEREETLLVQGGNNHKFHQLHLLDNRISFTPDSKKILFCAKSGGKDRLYLFDIEEEEVIREWSPALDIIQTPRLSPDGTKIVMVGVVLGQSDIYLLDIKTNVLTQLTFDFFADKDPALSGDNQFLLFSSNRNSAGDFENINYHIFEMNLKNQKITQFTFKKGKQLSPQYYYNNKNHRIIYTSTQTGTPNIFIKDKDHDKAYQFTDLVGGAYYPSLDKKAERLVFGAYTKQGYDISIRKAPSEPKDVKLPEESASSLKHLHFPVYPQSLSNFKDGYYNTTFTFDQTFFLLTAFYNGQDIQFVGLVYASISDYLGNHKVSLYTDYLAGSSGLTLFLNYGYLKKKTDFYLGVFNESARLSLYRLGDLNYFNNIVHGGYFRSLFFNNYGIYLTVAYPFTPFWQALVTTTFSRYEEIFGDIFQDETPNVLTNIYSLSLRFLYNNITSTIFGPFRGKYLSYSVEQSLNLSGNDYVYNRQITEFRGYYGFFYRYIFAIRGRIEHVAGPQADFFRSFVGGVGSIRGYSYFIGKTKFTTALYAGTTTFTSSFEFRFPVLDALLLGIPVTWLFPGFSGIFFIDVGAAINDFKKFKGYNENTGRLQDIKLAFGLGMRIVLVPGIYIRIDWGTPWDFKDSLPIGKWIGYFSIGADF